MHNLQFRVDAYPPDVVLVTTRRMGFMLFSGVSDGEKKKNKSDCVEAVRQRSYIDGAEGGIWAKASVFKPPLNILLYYTYWDRKYNTTGRHFLNLRL